MLIHPEQGGSNEIVMLHPWQSEAFHREGSFGCRQPVQTPQPLLSGGLSERSTYPP